MRDYEVVCIIQPDLDEANIKPVVDRISGWITDSGGTITKVEPWGKRRLAYELRKQREGYYVLLQAQMNPKFAHELERNLQFLEPVMRFLITAA